MIPPDISQQSDYIVLQISQEAIQNCDTSEYVALLHGITDSLQSFEVAFQKYVLLISGYDDDPRELYQIPEVVSFIKDLNSKLPFWLYFVNTSDKKFFSWMIACLCQAMSLDQDEETIYADFNAEAYNDLIEYQFRNIVKLMSGLGMRESIQEKVLKALSANLASLMVVENGSINDSDGNLSYNFFTVRHTPQSSHFLVKQTD